MTTYDVGVNYWPANTAMRWWRDFRAEDFARDARTIAEAGGTSVRVFLLWEDFQPEINYVSSPALANLREVADICDAHGLVLIPTLFTGHMSGANWLPRWATEPGQPGRFPVVCGESYAEVSPRNWFSDEEITRAQELLAREAAAALRAHPALRAWDLGNENSNVCLPATRDAGRAWLRRMRDALRAGDPGCQVTIGLHMEDLESDRRIGPAEAAEVCDFLCMHGYPLYAPWARSTTDPTLPAFLAAVTHWLGGKDVYFEEFGMPTPTTEDESAAEVFTAEALDLLYAAGTTGAMLWCFSDYVPAIWQQPPFDAAPHERFFGLWRADGSAKPAARHLARYANVERRELRIPEAWRDADRASFYADPRTNLLRMYGSYSKVVAL